MLVFKSFCRKLTYNLYSQYRWDHFGNIIVLGNWPAIDQAFIQCTVEIVCL